ncbi:peptide/nickel transport system ATP-binding protein [Cohaesibacter sp. ES.047]|uniref:dipeptide ABC transporter ATP-binding protein n=1 Tax=Cohaesibacter sp. ES.047 TaxID=1798205 RepID=UPI000BB8946B|nr:ABC transporter ATP-binding protein [Cohaesibacter sp. ES.047]SNY93103.1 peptide/nickel transport system ATP-binding protein [Cohaesibacter sp. ES.047]
MSALLSVQDLSVEYKDHLETRSLLKDVTLDLGKSEIVGLVGESGSGKSLLCRAIIGLLPSPKLSITDGDVLLQGRSLLALDESAMTQVRGGRIGMIFQNPTSHLDPVMRIGDQICEGLFRHGTYTKAQAKTEAVSLLDQVGFPDPARAFRSFAHEFSGGMRQRAMIAIALACEPDILIADEPTTALDVTVQAQILELLVELREKRGLSIILITHDLGVVAQTCDRIAVMQAGEIVEMDEKRKLLASPSHSYTRTLIASHPSFDADEAPQTSLAIEDDEHSLAPIFEVDDLVVEFNSGKGWFSNKQSFQALAGVSCQIFPGDTVGIVGESGSGKSTMARAMIGLTPVTAGHVTYDGSVLTLNKDLALKRLRREVAMVFQDPYNALNPRLTVEAALREVLETQGEIAKNAISARIDELLDLVGLDRSFRDRKPKSLSGGQCQRVGIARALAVNPKAIIADECVAALDVTIQAQIIALFKDLQEKMGLTIIFIAHDLAIVRELCETVIVMHHGRIVEAGRTEHVFNNPKQDYTANLLSAIPNIDPDKPIGTKLAALAE